ncbi:MAG TPA: glutathione synthase [Gammaproteobacteria bacterium]|nr:glutathione synthase [Gammaproteobacteria bacterium]
MSIKLAVVMDPLPGIHIEKDTTFALMLAAQARGYALSYLELNDLLLRDGEALGRARGVEVRDDAQDWYALGASAMRPLAEFDGILMRKDPPFNMEYIYATYLLEQAERRGALVVNRPQSLRDANEKLFTAWFPQCCPPTLVSREDDVLRAFVEEHHEVVLKPLDGMGGVSIFRVHLGDANLSVILEAMTDHGRKFVMAQRYLHDIAQGDKRILMIDGEPVEYALARIPAAGETRGNLAAGGRGEGRPLSERDRWIAAQVGPVLRERGLLFVGLDVIGDYLTEINVTSPTCVRELEAIYGIDIKGRVLDAIERRLGARR